MEGGHGAIGQDTGAQGSTWWLGLTLGTPSTRSGLAPHGHEPLSGAKCLLLVLLLLRVSSPSRRQAASTPAGLGDSTNWGISRLNEQPPPAWTAPGPRPQGSLRAPRPAAARCGWPCDTYGCVGNGKKGRLLRPRGSAAQGGSWPAHPAEQVSGGRPGRGSSLCGFLRQGSPRLRPPLPSSLHPLPQAQPPPLAQMLEGSTEELLMVCGRPK